jgi:hypothetical protein
MPTMDPLEPLAPLESGGTLTQERPVSTDDGDHERFAHYVPKDKIVESAVTGAPVRALCGKVWTPGRDPSKFPVCPDCDRIYRGLPPGDNKGGKGGKGGKGDSS